MADDSGVLPPDPAPKEAKDVRRKDMQPSDGDGLAHETVRDAAERMVENDVGTLVVVDPDGASRAVGIVTDRDVAIRCVGGGLDPDFDRGCAIIRFASLDRGAIPEAGLRCGRQRQAADRLLRGRAPFPMLAPRSRLDHLDRG